MSVKKIEIYEKNNNNNLKRMNLKIAILKYLKSNGYGKKAFSAYF